MFTLFVTFCLLHSPNECKERRVGYGQSEMAQQLIVSAQPTIAQWMDDHPGYSVKSFAVRRIQLLVDR